ncbi:MAG: glycosyltransferase family 4 protein [Pseudomonadota bacterium]
MTAPLPPSHDDASSDLMIRQRIIEQTSLKMPSDADESGVRGTDDLKAPRAVVLQMTARRDFAVARALHEGGALAAMATDLAVPPWLAEKLGGSWSRYVVNLPAEKVLSSPLIGLAYRLAMKVAGPHAPWPHIRAAKRTAAACIPRLQRLNPDIVFGLDTGALELFTAFHGASPRPRLVMEQCVAPRKSQLEMLDRLRPHLSTEEYDARKAYILAHRVREEAEWQMADIIVAPSQYVCEELEKAGCDPGRIRLVPYGYSPPPGTAPPEKKQRSLPLKGIFVGGVDHRKGVHDLAAAAKEFEGRIDFDVYGKLIAGADDITSWGRTLNFLGPRPFSEIQKAYQSADFLVLPSHLEGSAMVVYEAMAYGLPCIVTRETGSIIRDGVDGFIVDAGDRDGIARVFQRILDNPARLDEMSAKARLAAGTVSDTTYGKRLMAAVLS